MILHGVWAKLSNSIYIEFCSFFQLLSRIISRILTLLSLRDESRLNPRGREHGIAPLPPSPIVDMIYTLRISSATIEEAPSERSVMRVVRDKIYENVSAAFVAILDCRLHSAAAIPILRLTSFTVGA